MTKKMQLVLGSLIAALGIFVLTQTPTQKAQAAPNPYRTTGDFSAPYISTSALLTSVPAAGAQQIFHLGTTNNPPNPTGVCDTYTLGCLGTALNQSCTFVVGSYGDSVSSTNANGLAVTNSTGVFLSGLNGAINQQGPGSVLRPVGTAVQIPAAIVTTNAVQGFITFPCTYGLKAPGIGLSALSTGATAFIQLQGAGNSY